MSRPPSPFHSIEDCQASSGSSSTSRVLWTRDHNVNSGPGSFTVKNYSRVFQQTQRTQRYIRGTEEEEMEYEEYTEYKRSEIRLIQLIYHERLKDHYDWKTDRWIPLGCERSIFLAEIVSGVEKGTIVTVECFQGQGTPERWKHSFRLYSQDMRVSKAHLLGLNRSKIPLLIMLGELVPETVFARNMSLITHIYMTTLYRRWGCNLDDASGGTIGILMQDGDGPNPATTIDVLKEEVLLRYLSSFKSKEVDRDFVDGLMEDEQGDEEDVPEWVSQPTVICKSTNTPIPVANHCIWKSHTNSLVEREVLGNGWARFRLIAKRPGTSLWLGWDCDFSFESWLVQASRIFQARGVSLDDDLRDYKLVQPNFYLDRDLSDSEVDCERRLAQPIYLFVRPPPLNSPHGITVTHSHHYWSLENSGQIPLSPQDCQHFGLPVEFNVNNDSIARSWPNHTYELIHKYQVVRGFDTTTTDFARHLGCDKPILEPVYDSSRFQVVSEDCTTNPEHPMDIQQHENPTSSISSILVPQPTSNDRPDVAVVNGEHECTASKCFANKRQKTGAGGGGLGPRNDSLEQQELHHKNDGIGVGLTEELNIRHIRPLPKRPTSAMEFSLPAHSQSFGIHHTGFLSHNPSNVSSIGSSTLNMGDMYTPRNIRPTGLGAGLRCESMGGPFPTPWNWNRWSGPTTTNHPVYDSRSFLSSMDPSILPSNDVIMSGSLPAQNETVWLESGVVSSQYTTPIPFIANIFDNSLAYALSYPAPTSTFTPDHNHSAAGYNLLPGTSDPGKGAVRHPNVSSRASPHQFEHWERLYTSYDHDDASMMTSVGLWDQEVGSGEWNE